LGDDESGDLDPIVALASERVTTLLEVVADREVGLRVFGRRVWSR
jgi:hypothetical protein